MTRRAALRPSRNQPRQPRSRATVGVILDAAIRVLDREGLEALTTSRVAEVAGVSVGTLYQYFAHRDAIIDALQDRELARAGEMLERVLQHRDEVSDREVARAVVAELLRLYRAAPALHRVLAVDGLRYSTPERVLAFDARSIALVKAFLGTAGPRIRSTNLEAAAFVVYQAVRATMLSYLLESPAGVPDEVIVAEVTELVVRYLQA
ncbi:MAG TPA: TetR/AcrR family transcriptional regulator [Polyangiaceae bacterium]|nr:TetR/AcrR family transcriptional regulator [Polyangiaceae bacterium]